MEENKTITVMGKTINYGKLSDEKLIQLYRELERREQLLDRKILQYQQELEGFANI